MVAIDVGCGELPAQGRGDVEVPDLVALAVAVDPDHPVLRFAVLVRSENDAHVSVVLPGRGARAGRTGCGNGVTGGGARYAAGSATPAPSRRGRQDAESPLIPCAETQISLCGNWFSATGTLGRDPHHVNSLLKIEVRALRRAGRAPG